jgi:hypothetical protein
MAKKGSTSDTFGMKSRYISPVELIEVIEKMEKQKYELQTELSQLYENISAKKNSKVTLKAQKILHELMDKFTKYGLDYEKKSNIVKSRFKGRVSVNFKTTKEFDNHCNDMHCTKINILLDEIKAAKLAVKKMKALE